MEKNDRPLIIRILRSWFELTVNEQRALILVLIIFLIGIGVKAWHARHKAEARQTSNIEHSTLNVEVKK